MPGAILQAQKPRLLPDQLLVLPECLFRGKGLHEEDHKVHLRESLRAQRRLRAVKPAAPLFLDKESLRPDPIHQLASAVDEPDLVPL